MDEAIEAADNQKPGSPRPARHTRAAGTSSVELLNAQAAARRVAKAITPEVEPNITSLAKAMTPELTRTMEQLSKSVCADLDKAMAPTFMAAMPNLKALMPDISKQVGLGALAKIQSPMPKFEIPKLGIDMSKTLGINAAKMTGLGPTTAGLDMPKLVGFGALTGLQDQLKALAGQQSHIEDMFRSPSLARAARCWDGLAEQNIDLEASLASVADATVERHARQDRAAEATVATADAVGQLLAVSQAQQEQLGAMTGVLHTLAVQASEDSKADSARFWWGFGVGAATLAATIAVLWLTVLMWQAGSGG
jgi:hypothetical protein